MAFAHLMDTLTSSCSPDTPDRENISPEDSSLSCTCSCTPVRRYSSSGRGACVQREREPGCLLQGCGECVPLDRPSPHFSVEWCCCCDRCKSDSAGTVCLRMKSKYEVKKERLVSQLVGGMRDRVKLNTDNGVSCCRRRMVVCNERLQAVEGAQPMHKSVDSGGQQADFQAELEFQVKQVPYCYQGGEKDLPALAGIPNTNAASMPDATISTLSCSRCDRALTT